MSDLAIALGAFHFIRPIWLLLLPLLGLLWWNIRRSSDSHYVPSDAIADHLRAALSVGSSSRRSIRPIDGVVLALCLIILGTAGPTWSRIIDPFAAQSAPVVVALNVTPSMEQKDVPPSRLERGKQKIRDLLKLRTGARSALLAYAGTAHIVVPMTEDASVMTPYLEGLGADIMPITGNLAGDALRLAEQLLGEEDAAGGILFVTDGLDPADIPVLNSASAPVVVLSMLSEATQGKGLDGLNRPVIHVEPEDRDIRQIDRQLNAAHRQAALENTDQPWEDRGHWVAWPAALLILIWFRRGWTMRWAVVVGLVLGVSVPQPARADDIADWFFTRDQQGWRAFQQKDFAGAADRFIDPLWRGYALYRNGQYDKSIEVLARIGSAQSAFIQGMAHIKSRGYRDAVRAFEKTMELDPAYPGVVENLALAREIVDFIERVREQSETGEDSGIGADDVVFDNEAMRGTETQMEAAQDEGVGVLTTEQWMNTVDTRTGDFLRQRFAIETATRKSDGEKAQ